MSKEWLKAALIRAVKTFAQAMVAQIGAGSIGILQFDWISALSVSAMAGVLSLFTSLAGLPEAEYEKYPELRQHKDELQSNYIGDRFYTAHDAPEEDEDEREDI